MMTAQIPHSCSSATDADATARREFADSARSKDDFAAWLRASFYTLSPAPQTAMSAPDQDAESNGNDGADKTQLTMNAAASTDGADLVDLRLGECEVGDSTNLATMNPSENRKGAELAPRGVGSIQEAERLISKNGNATDQLPFALNVQALLIAHDLKRGDNSNVNDHLRFSADLSSTQSPSQTLSAVALSTEDDAAIDSNFISTDLPTNIDWLLNSLKGASDNLGSFAWKSERGDIEATGHQTNFKLAECSTENFPTPRQLSDEIKALVSALKDSSRNLSEKEATTKDAPPNAAVTSPNISALAENPRGAESFVNLRESAPHVTAQTIAPLLEALREMRTPETRSLRLLLHPKELGAVEIQLMRNANGSVNAHFIAAHEATRAALASDLAHLRESLARAGVAVEQLEVGLGLNPSSSQNQASREERQPSATSFQNAPAVSRQRTADATEQASVVHDKLVSLRA